MGPIWGRQDPRGPHVGPMNFVIWAALSMGIQICHTEIISFLLPFNSPCNLNLYPEYTWVFNISGLLHLAADSREHHIKYAQTFSPFIEQDKSGLQFLSLKYTWVSSLIIAHWIIKQICIQCDNRKSWTKILLWTVSLKNPNSWYMYWNKPALSHLPLDKMAAVSQTLFFNCIFLNENVWILIKISLNFVPKDSINDILALVQIMAWCRIGNKPLSELMLTCFTDAYMQQ